MQKLTMQTLQSSSKTKIQALVEKEIGNVEADEIISAIPETVQKLVWIIENEGISEGKRLKAEYIAKIIAERITADRFINRLKKEACHKNGHASNPFIILSQCCLEINRGDKKMCEYCKTTPHHPRCPLAEQPKSDIVCSCCKEDILEGDEYIEINSKCYHLMCVEDLDTRDILRMFDCEIKIKEANDEQYTLY